MNLSGKRVLVTGGTGFLGYFVCRALRQCGALVSAEGSAFDLTDGEAADKMFAASMPDAVVHLAAKCGGIGANVKQPATYLRDNLLMGLNVLDACVRHEVEKVLVVGTACSYPADAAAPFVEDYLWDGYPEPTNAPYGLAKRLILEACRAYRQQHGLNAVCVIPANLYGPRDNFDLGTSHVIPAVIRKVLDAKEAGRDEVTLWGSGKPRRDFVYVQDAAEGIVLALEKLETSDPVNLGSGAPYSIRAVAEQIALMCGWRGRFIWDTSRPDGQEWRQLSTMKAANVLGWTATLPLEVGLRITIDWYQEQRKEHAAAASAQ